MSTLFTGASRYSQDFSAVIDRQVAIQSLRLRQMQQNRALSNDRVTALKAVETKIAALQSALGGIEASVNAKALQTASSDATTVRATSSEGVAPGTYTMRVISLGSYSNTMSGKTVGDPTEAGFVADGTTELTLAVTDHTTGTPLTKTTTIALNGGTSLRAVVDAVNAQTGLNAQAAVVNIGTTDDPKYALTLQSTRLGKYALQLSDSGGALMDVDPEDPLDASLGSRAEYTINRATVFSDSRTVTLAPNLTAELVAENPARDVTVTVSRSTSAFETAAEQLVSAYNAVLDEIDKYTGKGGPLQGESLVTTVRQQMRRLISDTSVAGDLKSPAEIGLEFTAQGRLAFNRDLFTTAAAGRFDSLKALIGTSKTTGFMKVATDTLNALDGTAGGIVKDTISSLTASLRRDDDSIAAEQERIDQFTADLQDRIAKADALIAALEQQATYFTNMFEAMRANQKSM